MINGNENQRMDRLKLWQDFEQTINDNSASIEYRQGDVWWTSIGQNIGDEENGKGDSFLRPVLIVRGFSQTLFWGVPLSTNTKIGDYYHNFIIDGKPSTALLSQMRTYDVRRLVSQYGSISDMDFKIIKQKLIALVKD